MKPHLRRHEYKKPEERGYDVYELRHILHMTPESIVDAFHGGRLKLHGGSADILADDERHLDELL